MKNLMVLFENKSTKDLKKKQEACWAINSLINGRKIKKKELSRLTARDKELHKLLNNVNTTHFNVLK